MKGWSFMDAREVFRSREKRSSASTMTTTNDFLARVGLVAADFFGSSKARVSDFGESWRDKI
jgi:hypothetical protein